MMPPEVLDQPISAPAAAPAPAEPSLRETLEAAVAKTPITALQPDRDATVPQDNRTQAQRDRDERGRFAPRTPAEEAKARDGAEVPTQEELARANQPDEEQPHEESQTAPSPSIDNAPKSWKAGPREKWAGLDPDVRTEIHRRERESSRAINESAPVRRFAQTFQEAIAPFAQRYQASGMPPLQIMQNLMQVDTYLATAPMGDRAQLMAKMIQDYGIDLRALDAALSGGDPNTEPLAAVDQLINQRLAPLQEFVQSSQQQRRQTEQQEFNRQRQTIDQMAADTANFPHFDLVALDMADIMEMQARRKVYISHEEAYKRAVAASPEAQAAEQSRAGQQRSQQAHQAATRSLGASLSVSGSPAGLKQTVAPEDLRGTIEAAWNAHAGR